MPPLEENGEGDRGKVIKGQNGPVKAENNKQVEKKDEEKEDKYFRYYL